MHILLSADNYFNCNVEHIAAQMQVDMLTV